MERGAVKIVFFCFALEVVCLFVSLALFLSLYINIYEEIEIVVVCT